MNYMILQVFLPQTWYQHREDKYFRKVHKTTHHQQLNKPKPVRGHKAREQPQWMDEIQEYWMARLNRNHRASSRAVLQVMSDEQIRERISKNQR